MNGDGKQDIITGHYWPGDIFVFYGEGNGKFAKMDTLKDETGRNLNAGEPWKDESKPQMESLAAAPYATDFDGDGDFDMLIGNFVGGVVFMENIGGRKEPLFSIKRKKLEAGGKLISVPGGDAGPVFEDWNHDGVRDLIVGAGDGSVWFYENIGKDNAAKFAAGKKLVAESGWDAFPHGTVPKKSGLRSKVCVVDYNRDGLVDLLVGDFTSEEAAPLKLTEEEIKRRDELRAEQRKLRKQLQEIRLSGSKDQKERQEQVLKKYREIYSVLSQYEERNIYHGFVWFYQRKPVKTTVAK